MATLAAVLATTHHPFYLKATTMPPEQQMPQAPEWKRKVEAYRETLTRAKPDILVMVGADHFHQFFLDNYPTFLIGKAPRYDATFHNEIREFGLPKYTLIGDETASGYMLRRLMDKGFDMAVSFDLKIDHSIICPIITTRPEADLLVFRGKIEGKSTFTRGVFIALNDISAPARDAITRGKAPSFFVMNGHDLMMVLSEAISLTDFLRKRVRLLAEEGLVCVPFSELA